MPDLAKNRSKLHGIKDYSRLSGAQISFDVAVNGKYALINLYKYSVIQF